MTLTRAYHALIQKGCKYPYRLNDGVIVYDNKWTFLVVFQAMNRYNYAAVKYYNGEYKVIEL